MEESKEIQSEVTSRTARKKEETLCKKAIEDYRRLCLKTYSQPNSGFVSQLKSDTMSIFLDSYNLKDINAITKILGKYKYFKSIQLAPYDSSKGNPIERKKKGFGRETPLTPSEREKAEKDQKDSKLQKTQMLYHVIQGIAKNLCLSEEIILLSLSQLSLTQDLTSFLSEGVIENKSLKVLSVENCSMALDAYEILLKGFLTHEKIEYLNLPNNNFNDKFGNMIGRIIARQTQRRDQVIWAYGLRNERPLTNDYTKGLIYINLLGNHLGDISADNISNALSYDQYIRSIILCENNFSNESCKKFIYMLRKNCTLLNVDLRENPGYDVGIHVRIVCKLSKNIQILHKQFTEGDIEQEEYESMKHFIDVSFFEQEIEDDSPEEEAKEENEEGEENQEIEPERELTPNELREQNRQLISENLLLKKQIIEMKAKSIKDSEIDEIEKNDNGEGAAIRENYSKIVSLLNELNGLMDNVEQSAKNRNDSSSKEKEKEQKEKAVNVKKDKYTYQEVQAEPSEPNDEKEIDDYNYHHLGEEEEEEEEDEKEKEHVQEQEQEHEQEQEQEQEQEEGDYEWGEGDGNEYYEEEYEESEQKRNKSF